MTSGSYELPRKVKDVIVIGGGAAGVGATLGLLRDEDKYSSIRVFERRPQGGGLWTHTPASGSIDVPSLDPHTSVQPDSNLHWPSAVYDNLVTNVPYEMMSYLDFKWPLNTPLYPERQKVAQYLQGVAQTIDKYIEYGVSVDDVVQLPDLRWKVTVRPTNSTTTQEYIVDAVISACGHYDIPRIPDVEGLKEWNTKFPSSVSHSKLYRNSAAFAADSKIIVVGNSASAIDIANQLAEELPDSIQVYKSVRTFHDKGVRNPQVIEVPQISKFLADTKAVELVNGQTIVGVDKIIFATGYLKSVPYLKTINNLDKPIITDGNRLNGIYNHIVPYNYPGLAFVGIVLYGGPMILTELQGAWLSRLFQRDLQLPSYDEMVAWENNWAQKSGPNSAKFHELRNPDDVLYYNSLVRDIKNSRRPDGRYPDYMSQEHINIRASFDLLKKTYVAFSKINGASTGGISTFRKDANISLVESPLALGAAE
ncbi:thiol-specific monooxygenase [Yamadazyma tenuis]|uniref:FAD/NAD(P)-binding domain-containing protein n=1 Tax=Candida tenuis (strain ATCC 10573 / BCRC 21748 / CBS 615 / JCM 9827 / NBRC 10315 / NRRL Y-1498 / VKM Y-70) TaxID=590646 RepID=G3BAR7_CANTC|nr:uncharacterized protein CANTEDRAFT_125615 [Yamadazyma tenuis ATCC 10573]EGV62093.1 hypothetical protein CANTEDRAFT_125615 [Yamadazyma tenuis ATCC 10573]WEJ93341.1 thiol-specific monooxygenase [Yamadazyma tenuis]